MIFRLAGLETWAVFEASSPGFFQRAWNSLADRIASEPALVSMLGVALLLWSAALFLLRRSLRREEPSKLSRQWTVVLSVVVVLLFGLLLVPMDSATKGQVVQVLGIALPAAIALSATALLGNALGGLVLHHTAHFRLGDFIQVGEHFGRVSLRTLMNTQIQTEDRDLTTLPNLMLVTQPVKVIRRSGTIVSATVSLGYSNSWSKVEAALVKAAELADLTEPFVQVMELNDYSVVYRAAGMCTDVRSVLAKRADLRTQMLDSLHSSGIEVLSPAFVNLRQMGKDAPLEVPAAESRKESAMAAPPTDLIFDKADKAAALSQRRTELEALQKAMEDADETEHAELEHRSARLKKHIEYLARRIAEDEE